MQEDTLDNATGEGDGQAELVDDLLNEELLIEEISIDGMCGVY